MQSLYIKLESILEKCLVKRIFVLNFVHCI